MKYKSETQLSLAVSLAAADTAYEKMQTDGTGGQLHTDSPSPVNTDRLTSK